MRRPSFQFYPADWMGNTNLRRCSHSEKGAWIDVMCLMHDSEEYGVLRWPLKEIAAAASCKLADLKGLISKGVLKGSDEYVKRPFIYTPRSGRQNGADVVLVGEQKGPLWFSSRMVRDEYVRTVRGESSRFSATPMATPMASPKPPIGDGSSSSSAFSATQGEADEPPACPVDAKVTFRKWYERMTLAGEPAITGHAATWDYAKRIGLPDEYVALAWFMFKRRYTESEHFKRKKYADWRRTFRNALDGNWLKLWYATPDSYALTTQGIQAQREFDALETFRRNAMAGELTA